MQHNNFGKKKTRYLLGQLGRHVVVEKEEHRDERGGDERRRDPAALQAGHVLHGMVDGKHARLA